MAKFCPSCGRELEDDVQFCPGCGTNQDPSAVSNTTTQQNVVNSNPEAKSKVVAGLLGIFLGGWGIHNFYLGNTNRGIIQIVVTIVTCGIGALWGFIEGILILTGSRSAIRLF